MNHHRDSRDAANQLPLLRRRNVTRSSTPPLPLLLVALSSSAMMIIHRTTPRYCCCDAFPAPRWPSLLVSPAAARIADAAITRRPRRSSPPSSSCAWSRRGGRRRRHSSLPPVVDAAMGSSGSSSSSVPPPPESGVRRRDGEGEIHYLRPYLRQLLLLCRPMNFPVVALFHVLGANQAIHLWMRSTTTMASSSSSSSSSSPRLLLSLLADPSMLVVLLSLLLVTSTSMVTNDYYDARDGVDMPDDADHPLAKAASRTGVGGGKDGDDDDDRGVVVPMSIAKVFDSYLYAALLLSSAFVPGAMSRLMVLGGAIVTYLYTVHLKPKTWIKNASCAGLVAISPLTSGLAAWHVLCDVTRPFHSLAVVVDGGGGDGGGGGHIPWFRLFQSPMSSLVLSLFAGMMGREILMDIADSEGDARAGIETVPVKYGRGVASGIAFGCSVMSAISACGASLMPWIGSIGGGIIIEQRHNDMSGYIASLAALAVSSKVRNVLLSVAGSGMLLRRTYGVWRTNGEDVKLVHRAVEESLISVVLVLASFL
ncbi:hypothetical protein ACHAXA_008255 [Cyclostephanos tholiformis]|uniref:Uncharacterized protein n=1 Tax=Cyclostephanos tholiformis TaxID=382380 RepID=A0ABD3RBE3_9STRA